MEYYINVIIIVVLLLSGGFMLIRYLRQGKDNISFTIESFEYDYITSSIAEAINNILNTDVEDLKLNEAETRKRTKQKSILRDSIRNCCLGDAGKREYVKEYIKSLLQDGFCVNEGTINQIVPFHKPDKLSNNIKFIILYFFKSKEYGNKTYGYLCDNEWSVEKVKDDGIHYEIDENDIEESFQNNCYILSFPEKLEVVTQLIYQDLYGLDVVDVIISDDSIDNCSGGVGGITELDYNYLEEMMNMGQTRNNCYDSIFVMYHGKQIRQTFLSFGSKERLMRVVKNIYRYDAPEMLNAQNGYIVGSRQDNARITVARPNVSASWAFFLRKFKSTLYDLNVLLTGERSDLPISILKWIVESNETFTVSGSPAAGKTTMLKALVPLIDPRLTIRVAESVFETTFNELLPERNIQVMQERGNVKIKDIINAFKKMDTDITILGEITEPDMAGAFIQIAQSGGRMTMCTLHHETTKKLIEYIRNGLMVHYDISDSEIAEKQVISVLNYDIHMAKDESGYRYIERITEIVPIERPVYNKVPDPVFLEDMPLDDRIKLEKENIMKSIKVYLDFMASNHTWKPYTTRDIIVFDTEKRRYALKNRFSDEGLERMSKKLPKDRMRQLVRFLIDEIESSKNRG